MTRAWDEVDRYYTEMFQTSDPVMEEVLAASKRAGLPDIQVSPLQGRMLMLLVQASGAGHVLEVGTLGGYSTIWMARGLPMDGRLISLEYEARHAKVARDNIARAGFEPQAEVRLGAGADSMKALIAERALFDFIFIDADKGGYPAYLELALQLTKPGSLILADNMVREGKIARAGSGNGNVEGPRRFNELVKANPRLSATAIQTVGVKGYDGFVLARVTV